MQWINSFEYLRSLFKRSVFFSASLHLFYRRNRVIRSCVFQRGEKKRRKKHTHIERTDDIMALRNRDPIFFPPFSFRFSSVPIVRFCSSVQLHMQSYRTLSSDIRRTFDGGVSRPRRLRAYFRSLSLWSAGRLAFSRHCHFLLFWRCFPFSASIQLIELWCHIFDMYPFSDCARCNFEILNVQQRQTKQKKPQAIVYNTFSDAFLLCAMYANYLQSRNNNDSKWSF